MMYIIAGVITAIIVLATIGSALEKSDRDRKQLIVDRFQKMKADLTANGAFLSDYEFRNDALFAVSSKTNSLLCYVGSTPKHVGFSELSHIAIEAKCITGVSITQAEIILKFLDGTSSKAFINNSHQDLFRLYSLIEKNLGKEPFSKHRVEQETSFDKA